MLAERDERLNPADLIAGKHITYFVEPDIIYLRFGGAATTEDSLELLRRQVAMAKGKSLLFFLIDAERLENIAPEGRRAVAETLKELPLRGMAVVRAPLKAKVVAKLVITAINLFRKDANLNPVSFFDSEADGLAWIAQRRELFAQ
ncbi:MAG: hypothetical protein ACJ75H_20645 [Thermoanaerobaculia bacterium]